MAAAGCIDRPGGAVTRRWCVAGALAAATALASCGAPQTGVGAPQTGVGAPVSPTSASPGRPPVTLPVSQQLLAAARTRLLPRAPRPPAGSVAADWSLLGVLDGGRRVVLQTAPSGGCATFVGVVVTEGADVVTISPRTMLSRRPGTVCPDHRVLTAGSVLLAAPLGSRRLSQG